MPRSFTSGARNPACSGLTLCDRLLARHRRPTAHARARYRCFLPDLAGLAGRRRVGPMPDLFDSSIHQAFELLWKPDLPQQLRISRIVADGIKSEISGYGDQTAIVLFVRHLQPFEGMVLIVQLGVQLRNSIRRNVRAPRFSLGETHFESFA